MIYDGEAYNDWNFCGIWDIGSIVSGRPKVRLKNTLHSCSTGTTMKETNLMCALFSFLFYWTEMHCFQSLYLRLLFF